MNGTELISVIVPVYNVEDYLYDCLSSIGNQSYKNLEIILVDDGSTDASGKICDDFAERDSRVKVIHQSNQGLWAARNTGQDYSSGTYLFFPDSDDYLDKDIVHFLYEAINMNGKKYALSLCHDKKFRKLSEIVVENTAPRFSLLSRETLLKHLLLHDQYTSYSVPNQWNKLYRVSSLKGMHSRNYERGQDRDFQMRFFLEINEAVLVEKTLYYWRQRADSLSVRSNSAILRYKCRSEMTFENYRALTEDNIQYAPMFLAFLYKSMLFYKNLAWKTAFQRKAFVDCKKYERDTIVRYIIDGEGSLLSKLGILFLLHCLPITRILMRLSNN